MKTFAAIMIGSAETEMRIYEFLSRGQMREIDCISTRMNLGVDAYRDGMLDPEKVQDLVALLKEFRTIMDAYGVSDYRINATSALRELRSGLLTRDYIEKQTGLKIQIISNSDQRFLDYKAIAFVSKSFEEIIQKGSAIVDIGGNSMQISVFDKDKLVTTQNIRMGKISSREKYFPLAKNARHYAGMLTELLEHEMAGFAKLYQKDRQILNMIILDNDLLDLVSRMSDSASGERPESGKASSSKEASSKEPKHKNAAAKASGQKEGGQKTTDDVTFHISAEDFRHFYDSFLLLRDDEICEKYEVSPDTAQRVMQSMIFCRCLLDQLGAQTLWLLDADICDGMAYDFGVAGKMIRKGHDFDEDIIAASRNIAKRYKCSQAHIKNMEELALGIFDRMKKIHGMKKRERLLLQIAVILHNCGKYISLTNVSDCAYNIIMATEIIGLSYEERRIIASAVRFNNAPFQYYSRITSLDPVNREEYLLIAKLTAILRVVNALDRSHRQKCAGAVIALRENELVISVQTKEDLSLEKITLKERAPFFEEVFNVHPVIRQKK